MIQGQTVCEEYQIVKKIGQGSFGLAYKIKHRVTKEPYALKTCEKSITKMELQNQRKILQYIHLNSDPQQNCIGQCLKYVQAEDNENMMIMPLYGENIFNLFNMCKKRFDSQTIHHISKQILKRIQCLHQLGVIHRDIKPQNFVVGRGHNSSSKNDQIYLIDFGLAKFYKQKGKHVNYQIGKKVRGTPMYMSINILLGIQPSRRDDIESLFYIIVFLMKGKLPWYSVKITKNDLSELITAKIKIKPEELFQDLPQQLKTIYVYIRNLQFQDIPDYEAVDKALQSILSYKKPSIQEQFTGAYVNFCWEALKNRQIGTARYVQVQNWQDQQRYHRLQE